MRKRTFILLPTCLLLAGLAKAFPEQAVNDKVAADKIKVTVVVILAGEDGNEIDPRLAQIAAEVQKRDPQLKAFKVKSMTFRKLAENEKSVFNLVDQKTVEVVIKQVADDDNRVGIAVTAPDQGEIAYRTACGKYLPIVTRYQTKNRERLIVALRVDPCQ